MPLDFCSIAVYTANMEVKMMAEKTITIRVDDETYKKIKVAVAGRGTTLKDYVLSLIDADFKSKK